MTDQSESLVEPAPPEDINKSQFQRSLTDPLGMHQLAEAETFANQAREYLDAEHAKMIEDVGKDFHDHGPLEVDGVDLTALKQADPSFNDEAFIDIARECFLEVRKARTYNLEPIASGILTPQLEAELKNAIDGDVASHRHHLLPMLTIKTAKIVQASAGDGKPTVVVCFHLSSEELDRNDQLQVIAGSDQVTEWDEDWTFWRDPSVDTSAADEDHILSPESQGEWSFAHKGWTVTKIDREGPQDPLDPTNI